MLSLYSVVEAVVLISVQCACACSRHSFSGVLSHLYFVRFWVFYTNGQKFLEELPMETCMCACIFVWSCCSKGKLNGFL